MTPEKQAKTVMEVLKNDLRADIAMLQEVDSKLGVAAALEQEAPHHGYTFLYGSDKPSTDVSAVVVRTDRLLDESVEKKSANDRNVRFNLNLKGVGRLTVGSSHFGMAGKTTVVELQNYLLAPAIQQDGMFLWGADVNENPTAPQYIVGAGRFQKCLGRGRDGERCEKRFGNSARCSGSRRRQMRHGGGIILQEEGLLRSYVWRGKECLFSRR